MRYCLPPILSLLLLTACGQLQSASQTPSEAGTAVSAEPVDVASADDFVSAFRRLPISEWPGAEFMVPTGRLAFAPFAKLLKFAGSNPVADTYTEVECKDLFGKRFTFREFINRKINDRDRVLAVFREGSVLYASVMDTDMDYIKSPGFNGQIEGLVNVTEIERIRKLIVGKTVYPLVHQGHDSDTTNNPFADNNDVIYLPKYVPVTVRNVEPGQVDLPLKVTVTFADDQVDHRAFYGFNSDHPDDRMNRSFTRFYSATDPRSQHISLKDPFWKAVQAGAPAKGMTTDECEIAMGKPDSRLDSFDKKQMTEWFYKDHMGKSWNVEFIDGKVERYLNYDN